MARTAKEINDKLRRLVNDQKKVVDQALLSGANALVSDVRANFPKDSGETAEQYDVIEKRGTRYPFLDGPGKFYKVVFKKRNFIAFFQEFGTVTNPPQPTIRPAWARHVNKIKNQAVNAGKEIINKYK
jgi:HK97 gp10 family phage protein